jgi:hypothetical protein
VTQASSDHLSLECEDGSIYEMLYYAECCASCELIDGLEDLQALIGHKIEVAEEVESREMPADKAADSEYSNPDSFTWTFYTIRTNQGTAVLRWYGSSNGYYSESVTFEQSTLAKVKRKAEKVIRNGKVAVLYSPRFGAGWSSWGGSDKDQTEFLLFDKSLVELAEANATETDPRWNQVLRAAGYAEVYLGGIDDGLQIEWLDEGTQFEVHEYDGAESVEILGPTRGHIA